MLCDKPINKILYEDISSVLEGTADSDKSQDVPKKHQVPKRNGDTGVVDGSRFKSKGKIMQGSSRKFRLVIYMIAL